MTMTSTENAFDWAQLPPVVGNYLRAHVAQDFSTAVTYLADDATVIDNGETLRGREETLKLFNESAERYEVTTTLDSISTPADDVWQVDTHLSGNFPGGEVDLKMIFTLRDTVIQRLEITV
ncbi:MAG: nuclear transport factor 2 family protein [Solirubrobacteraceae bacterium]|nr:nuclear transport factor 2 family protein [Solirubrobacteraceae bacterium]